MLNEKKIEEIRGRIQASQLLTDHEKSDWLNLLELMNDKQLSELEEILDSSVANTDVGAVNSALSSAVPSSAATSSTPAQGSAADLAIPKYPPIPQKMPPLSHISNLPTNLDMPQTDVASPVAQPPRTPVPTSTPARPNIHPPINKPFIPASPKPVTPVAVKPQAATELSKTKPTADTSRKILKTDRVEDVQAFSADTIRSYDLQSVVDAVRGLIEAHGYFQVLQYIESSPLYDSYINSGKERLKAKPTTPISTNSLLTQAEFEFMTDLLRHMRFNKW